MNITIFGLGYVGVVTAGCLAKEGHKVTGVDVSALKVNQINAGQSPIIEERIEDFIRDGRKSGFLSATTKASEAIPHADIALVCVGTPSATTGSLNTRFLEAVISEIGTSLPGRSRPLLVVVRSTLLPGTMRSLVLPMLEKASGKKAGREFELVFHPEFLREGSSVKDFYDPPKIVVGERTSGNADLLLKLYERFTAPIFRTSYEVAEMVKYTDNIFHALKITFANEIGQFCRVHGIDAREVMDIFCSDTKLNLSANYLRPGFAFGGSCLPKDLRAFLYAAQHADISIPMLAGILPSNKLQIERALNGVLATGARKIGLWGLAFKPGTDDLRESPLVTLAELLSGKGVEIRIFDKFVQVARLLGGNKTYIEQHLPHLARMMVTSAQELESCDLIVVGHPVDNATWNKWLAQRLRVYNVASFD
jgi:GDP-mannose 6-dehydrogenase